MTDAWDGSFTFVLTDIEGSTRLWENAPADMARALARHEEILEQHAREYGGRLVRSQGEGDSAFLVFDDAPSGVACGVAIQAAFASEVWPAATPLRVRIGVHAGPAQSRDGDYYGPAVNRAARLRAVAHGGQLVVSQAVREAMGRKLPDGASVVDLGLHRLKDLTRPERIWQVNHPRTASEFPPLRSLNAKGHNLPVQLTTFIGRDLEIRALRKRLESTPLLTLAGPGGIGKTRLALQVAAEAADDFPDGVWLAELAPLSDPHVVPVAIASVLGVREEPGRDLLTAIAEHITSHQMLLVLDNCEHVVDAAASAVDTLLRSSETLRVLATSREPLRVYGEATYSVAPLEVPSTDDLPPEEAASSDGVRLFVDRAALADHQFALDHAQAPHVASICRRLDGIPLAIELAAALVRTTSPADLASRLTDRLATLSEGPRTAPGRQQTLRAALDWSHDLLSDDEKAVFARLSVFAGGFTATAAAEVCDASGEVVSSLADRSLITVREARYVMLETVREYAREALGDDTELRHRHLAWAAALGRRSAPGLFGPHRTALLNELTGELDNFRVAMGWATTEGAAAQGAEIAATVWYAWFIRGLYREGREWLDKLLPRLAPDDPHRAKLQYVAGQLALVQGDQSNALGFFEECVRLATEAGDIETVGLGLSSLAGVAVHQGRVADAKDKAFQALNLLRRVGQPHNIAQALNILGVASGLQGELEAARNFYEEALSIARELGARENISRILMNLGNLALGRKEYERAKTLYEECLVEARGIGDVQAISSALTNLGSLSKIEGNHERAQEYLEETLALKRELGDGRGISVALQVLGEIHRIRGHHLDAHAAILECLSVARELEYGHALIMGMEAFVSLRVDEGRFEDAARMLGATDAARDALGIPRTSDDTDEYERCAAAVAGFEPARRAGGALSLEAAVAEVLSGVT